MAKEFKQFNFKLPPALFKQLKDFSEAKGITATELVIQGIEYVLGIKSTIPQKGKLDSELYEQLDKTEQRLQEFIDYQSAVDIKISNRIQELEQTIEGLKASLSVVDVIQNVFKDIRPEASLQEAIGAQQGTENIDASSLTTKTTHAQSGLAESLASNLDKNNIDESLDQIIDKTLNSTPEGEPASKTSQLKIIDVEPEPIPSNARKINTQELLKLLQQADPDKNWDNQMLTTYRRLKKYLGKWHQFGKVRFKYADEKENSQNASKNKHLWWTTNL
jgi:hypothetical protein